MPVGPGIGATQLLCVVMSVILAAGMPPMITVADPNEIIPGPAGTQPGKMHGRVISDTLAAGMPPISTLTWPDTMARGNGGWGTGVGVGAGGWMGA